MAWNPQAMTKERMLSFPRQWAAEQFGKTHAAEIGNMITRYSLYSARRKPELISPNTYHLQNYREADRVVEQFRALENKALALYDSMEESYKDAFYQLVLFPIQACANLNEMYVTAAKNYLYADQGRAAANDMARRVEELFKKDSQLTAFYHHCLADGKWNHMMSQTHIGYTYWQEPPVNVMPAVKWIKIPEKGQLKICPDPDTSSLPELDPYGCDTVFFEIYNTGKASRRFTLKTEYPWLHVSSSQGSVDNQLKIFVTAHWDEVPAGRMETYIAFSDDTGNTSRIPVNIFNPVVPELPVTGAFFESNGCVA
jgi:hypothetical protein